MTATLYTAAGWETEESLIWTRKSLLVTSLHLLSRPTPARWVAASQVNPVNPVRLGRRGRLGRLGLLANPASLLAATLHASRSGTAQHSELTGEGGCTAPTLALRFENLGVEMSLWMGREAEALRMWCVCESPVIRCDDRGCRCTVCGRLEDVMRPERERAAVNIPDWMSRSYPYLSIARHYDLDYGVVLGHITNKPAAQDTSLDYVAALDAAARLWQYVQCVGMEHALCTLKRVNAL